MAKLCFSLVCPPEVEEKLLDALLVAFGDEVFTSIPVSSHGTAHGRLSPAEHVMGRSRSLFVQVIVTDEEANALHGLLLREFAGTGIRYWAVELAMEGEIA